MRPAHRRRRRTHAPPGVIARLRGSSLSQVFKAKQSAHDWGLSERLPQAELVGHHPTVVVVAVGPQDMATFDTELGPCLSAKLPAVAAALASKVEAAAGEHSPNKRPFAAAEEECLTTDLL